MNNFFRKFFGIAPVGAGLTPAHSPSPTLLWDEQGENQFFYGQHVSNLYRSRFDYDRQIVLAECLRAWRVNPLARRIVGLQTDFIIGEGLGVKCEHKVTQKFLLDWWNHPLNNFDEQIPEWCDELSRAGNLFFLISVNPMDGMTYVRPLPAEQVQEILCAENDVRQETRYLPEDTNAVAWEAYDQSNEQPSFVLHFTVNRPVGSPWGEPMLAPLLDVLGRYKSWLEDRARLNHFRTAFMYVVDGKYASEADRQKRETHFNSHKPNSGSVLVQSENEKWSTLSAQLDSSDAAMDGLSMKKTIAAGAGIPLHYLAEPESSTRTTAEAAGTPAFRSLERRQKQFLGILKQMAGIAVAYRKRFDSRVNMNAEIQVISPDITERDNSLLSLAVARIQPPLMELFDRELMDSPEVLRLVYRMAGETFDETKPLPDGKRKPLVYRSEFPLPEEKRGEEDVINDQ